MTTIRYEDEDVHKCQDFWFQPFHDGLYSFVILIVFFFSYSLCFNSLQIDQFMQDKKSAAVIQFNRKDFNG